MKFFHILAASIYVATLLFTLFVGKNAISDNGISLSPAEYRGILTVWHIDTFEGGVGSRKQFLLSVGRDFEKQNPGVLVMVIDYKAESAEKAMEEGKFPDLISYGAGVKVKNLQPIDAPAANPRSGVYNGETYALSWCRGGYCIIENPEFTENKNVSSVLVVSQGEYTTPLLAYVFSDKAEKNPEILPPTNAYIKFATGKSRYLLGTQRDIHRLIARGMDFTVKPLGGYNDLYQYVSVTSADFVKAKYARDFAKYLLTDNVQKKLNKIGMFSCTCGVEYDSPELALMQQTEIKTVLSAFSSKELIQELQQHGIKAAAGDSDEFLKIKKLISYS